MINPVRAAETRRIETPNATMTTLASPTLGAGSALSLWQVEMAPGARGPRHVFDAEQLWTVLEGSISVSVAGSSTELAAGDTVAAARGSCASDHGADGGAAPGLQPRRCCRQHPRRGLPRGTPAWIA